MSGGIVVFAYSEVGYACLELLLKRGDKIDTLFTHKDVVGERQWFRSCATLARAHSIPVYTVEPNQGDEVERVVREAAPDLILSFYYRKMIPERILAYARLGAFNMHGGLLPKYRGRAPLNWAIINGETQTGVTLHVMVRRADAGDIVDQEVVAIDPDETAGEVAPRVVDAAARIVARQINALKAGIAPRHVQDESAGTYFGARKPEDGRIDWNASAKRVHDLIRALALPFPGAFTSVAGRKLLIWRARIVPDGGQKTGGPGEVLSLRPLLIATGGGAVEVLYFGFEGEDEQVASEQVLSALKMGTILGA